MKKRNKKTGKVQTCDFMVISDDISRDGEIAKLNSHVFIFRSIEQLNEEYEDYKPVEPLIKDEKNRKAVRAWAEANGVSEVMVAHPSFDTTALASISDPYKQISFSNERAFLPKDKVYTNAELCGEEEE